MCDATRPAERADDARARDAADFRDQLDEYDERISILETAMRMASPADFSMAKKRFLASVRAAPLGGEPGASTVEHVMELVQEYAFVFGCHEEAVAPKRDALRAAVTALAAGRDPREVGR